MCQVCKKLSYTFRLWFHRIVTEGERKEVWRLTVENASSVMKSDEKDREQKIYKDVSSSLTFALCANGRTNELFLMSS